jgi:hypothetical protein
MQSERAKRITNATSDVSCRVTPAACRRFLLDWATEADHANHQQKVGTPEHGPQRRHLRSRLHHSVCQRVLRKTTIDDWPRVIDCRWSPDLGTSVDGLESPPCQVLGIVDLFA